MRTSALDDVCGRRSSDSGAAALGSSGGGWSSWLRGRPALARRWFRLCGGLFLGPAGLRISLAATCAGYGGGLLDRRREVEHG